MGIFIWVYIGLYFRKALFVLFPHNLLKTNALQHNAARYSRYFSPRFAYLLPDLPCPPRFSQGKVKIDGPQTPRKSGKIDTKQRKLMGLSFFVDDWGCVWSISLVADERRTIKTKKPHNHETRKSGIKNMG